MINYTELRNKYRIVVDKTTDTQLACLTHYLQNQKNGVSQFYREPAIEYYKNLDLVEDIDLFSEYCPIFWDIPFPSPVNPKFNII